MFSRRFIVVVRCLIAACFALASIDAVAQQVPISRYARFTGNVNFVATGGSLRTESDIGGNSCAVGTSNSRALTGIPAGASIVAAYLYWGGSGSTVDATVALNGVAVSASRTFQAAYPYSPDLPFFGGFADVTNRVSGNGTYTFSGLTVNTGAPHCAPSAVQAGWGLIAIYGSPSERLRAINVFDGLQYFRGSALTLTPNGFRIPASNIDGRVAVITWEGDPGNSDPLNGFSESLSFNGTLVDDGLVPAGSSPATQQYDGTVNSQGATNSYGADIDTYDVSTLLTPGSTSASTQYSAGGDLVLLTAQIVSVTSEPIVDLSVSKTHAGDFTVGSNATYTITVSSEAGSQQTDFPITVTDTLPAGLTYVSGSGTGWSCGASGQLVTCTHAGPLNANASLPPIALTVAVGNAAYPSVTNTVAVTTPSNDPDATNNSATDTAPVLGSNLSTSTKTVQDLNGGDANPGDTLRYTITLTETAGIAASGVVVTDDVPSAAASFNVTALPAGATNNSTGAGTGANGTGRIDISGVNVPANGSVAIVFDMQIAAGVAPGSTIDNTASIDNLGGTDATPAAPQVIVSQSQIPSSGTKQLYLRASNQLHRTPPSAAVASTELDPNESASWTLSPALSLPLTLAAGGFNIPLWLTETGSGNDRSLEVTLSAGATQLAQETLFASDLDDSTPRLRTVTLTLPVATTVPAGQTLRLTLRNRTSGSNRRVRVHPFPSAGNYSRVELNSLSVINIDSIDTYSAAYAGGVSTSAFNRGAVAYVRTVVSDPFGSFDIAGANITILDPSSSTVVTDAPMTQVADSGAATRTYEYAFTVPPTAVAGTWTARILAQEGTENTVTDLGIGAFDVVTPALSIQKSTAVLSDPVNATSNPKRIPGSILRYTVTVTNTGQGSIDASTLVITDPLPSDVELCVAATCGGALSFANGAPPSGLSFTYATDVSYSAAPSGGAPFTHSPSATPEGYDPNIRGIRIAPTGVMSGASGTGSPSFSLSFSVRVK